MRTEQSWHFSSGEYIFDFVKQMPLIYAIFFTELAFGTGFAIWVGQKYPLIGWLIAGAAVVYAIMRIIDRIRLQRVYRMYHDKYGWNLAP